MNDITDPCTCSDCGYQWQRGTDGSHYCPTYLKARIAELEEAAKPRDCKCWGETNAKLEEQGFRLSPALSSLSLKAGLSVVRHLPITKLDGSKLKRSDPHSIDISHCPWCGAKYPDHS